jgi:hypothetical protein
MNSPKSSGWTHYFFILAGLFLAYNIAGVYYNQKHHRLYGAEAIPHIEKWRQLPGTLRELWAIGL